MRMMRSVTPKIAKKVTTTGVIFKPLPIVKEIRISVKIISPVNKFLASAEFACFFSTINIIKIEVNNITKLAAPTIPVLSKYLRPKMVQNHVPG